MHTKSTGVLTCHICLYQMGDDDKDEFKNHVKKHKSAASKQCVICDEGSSENFDLRYHVQKHVSNECPLTIDSFILASQKSTSTSDSKKFHQMNKKISHSF